MKDLHYSVTMSQGRRWGIRFQWWGWRTLFSVGINTNFMAPAILVNVLGMSVWLGRIRKETTITGSTLLDILEEKEKK